MRKFLAGLLLAALAASTPAAAAPLPAQRVRDICAVFPLLAGTYERYAIDREGDVRLDGRLVYDCAPDGTSVTDDDSDVLICVILIALHGYFSDDGGIFYISSEGDWYLFLIFVWDCPPYAVE